MKNTKSELNTLGSLSGKTPKSSLTEMLKVHLEIWDSASNVECDRTVSLVTTCSSMERTPYTE